MTRRVFLATGGAVAASTLLDPSAAAARPVEQPSEDGYELWLRYRRVTDPRLLARYRQSFTHVVGGGVGGPVRSAADELVRGLSGLLDRPVEQADRPRRDGAVVIGTRSGSALVAELTEPDEIAALGAEGYLIRSVQVGGHQAVLIAGGAEAGVVYGAFHLLRLLQTQRPVTRLDLTERPANPLRMANHWDFRDRVVQWGYVGASIFHYEELPAVLPRYVDYARALASIGINGSVVNMINAEYEYLTSEVIRGLVPLAGILRDWGVKLFIAPNFFSPRALGGLPTADPLDPAVRAWWRDKVDEIYAAIPDFGGFLVKADSEGQPGPLAYGRTHADGANVMAEPLARHGGVVIWRAFVGHEGGGEFVTAAYNIFTPLDGEFAPNAIVQVKHGPLDFQIRESVHPLFGAMPNTNLMLELQVTKEYTGSVRHLVYLPTQWAEVLGFDTYADGPGTTVATVVGGSGPGGMAGVMNFGSDLNWTHHHLSQANTHGFGRLAWNPALAPADLAEEWVRMTYGPDPVVLRTLTAMLLGSREIYESYTAPGMCGMTGRNDPTPEWGIGVQPDASRIGVDRTVATGTGSIAVYHPPHSTDYESLDRCPDELLLFFHRLPYEYRRRNGKTVIQTIYDAYFAGVEDAKRLRSLWQTLRGRVDERRYAEVLERFDDQVGHATVWRDRMVSHLFRLGTRLDERRSWLQLELPTGSLLTLPTTLALVGGWPNRLDVRAGNAAPATRRATVRLAAAAGWQAEPAAVTLAPRQVSTVPIMVTPPLDPEPARISLAVDGGGLTLGTAASDAFVLPAGQRAALALDAGPNAATVPVMDGYRRLSPADQWDPARGFGWVGAVPRALDRGFALDDLRRDIVYEYEPRTLRIAVPPGRFTALVLVGDREWAPIYPTYVRTGGRLVAEGTPDLDGGDFSWLRFELDGGTAGREVDLEFSTVDRRWTLPQQAPTTGAWHLNALLLIDLDAPMPDIAVTDVDVPQPMNCGRPNELTVTVSNTTQTETISVTPRVQVPAGWTAGETTVTVAAGRSTVIAVPVTPPPEPTLAVPLVVTVEAPAHTVAGGRHEFELIAAPAGADAVLALDAGGATGPLAAGYARLAPESAWSAGPGFGWIGGAPQFRDRGAPVDVLRRDFVNDVSARSLRIRVPAGPHRVDLLTGDSVAPAAPTYVHEGGTLVAESAPLWNAFAWLTFTLDGGAEGRDADLVFSSTTGQHWHLNALVLHP